MENVASFNGSAPHFTWEVGEKYKAPKAKYEMSVCNIHTEKLYDQMDDYRTELAIKHSSFPQKINGNDSSSLSSSDLMSDLHILKLFQS